MNSFFSRKIRYRLSRYMNSYSLHEGLYLGHYSLVGFQFKTTNYQIHGLLGNFGQPMEHTPFLNSTGKYYIYY